MTTNGILVATRNEPHESNHPRGVKLLGVVAASTQLFKADSHITNAIDGLCEALSVAAAKKYKEVVAVYNMKYTRHSLTRAGGLEWLEGIGDVYGL
jgi:hypothetical protein